MKTIVKVSELTQEEISNLLSAGLYGSPFWSVDNTTKEYKEAQGDYIEDKLAYMLLHNQSVLLIDVEEGDRYELTLNKLCKGVSLNIENGGSVNIEEYDLVEADNCIQYAIFNDVIWG